MLIEQTIELQLRGPGPPGRTNTPITGYFYDKTKISKENLRVDYYLLLTLSLSILLIFTKKFFVAIILFIMVHINVSRDNTTFM